MTRRWLVLVLLTLIAGVLVASVVLWQTREPESSWFTPAPCPTGSVCA
jgi:hypothetical protein